MVLFTIFGVISFLCLAPSRPSIGAVIDFRGGRVVIVIAIAAGLAVDGVLLSSGIVLLRAGAIFYGRVK